MYNSQTLDQTSDPTLSKLLEADSDLAAQAATLSTQLEAIQEKRRSLQAVISMFSSADNSAAGVEKQFETNGKSESSAASSVEPEPELAAEIPAAEPSIEAAPQNGAKVSGEAKPADKKRKSTKVAKATKPAGRDTTWRRYVRKEYSKTSLPEAVANVLQSHPEEVFEVPAIVNTIFVDGTPKEARSEARNRVSNVLSIGLKDNKWYRGKKGQYSVSSEAAKASVAS